MDEAQKAQLAARLAPILKPQPAAPASRAPVSMPLVFEGGLSPAEVAQVKRGIMPGNLTGMRADHYYAIRPAR